MKTTIEPKYIKFQTIVDHFNNLTKQEKIDILWGALSHMESYNGRGQWYTIALAMGYRNVEGGHDTWTKGE